MSYKEPTWAQPPSDVWTLTEIKSGVQVATHPLDRPCTLLGRAEDVVQIPLQHESCSRIHARIAFDSTGTCWLRDLGSTHGSTVNKKAIPPQACGKLESDSVKPGSRGIVLYPGDVVQFGASSRIFCVDGPSEVSREAVKLKQKMAQIERKNHSKAPHSVSSQPLMEKKEDSGVSWGMTFESEEETAPVSFELPIDVWEDRIPDNHRKAWDRLKTLKYKLENMQTESERIRRKGDLSEGQERRLEQNKQLQTKLEEEIREKEEELYRKLHPEKSLPKSSTDDAMRGDDEVEDRTAHDDSVLDNDGETEESLTRKWKELINELTTIQAELHKSSEKLFRSEKRVAALEAAGDEDLFFAKNDLDLVLDGHKKFNDQSRKATRNLDEIEEMLKVVNPKLTIDRASGFIGLGPVPSLRESSDPSQHPAMEPPPAVKRASMPPPSFPPQHAEMAPPPDFVMPAPKPTGGSKAKNSFESLDSLPPPAPKRPRVVGPSFPPTAAADERKMAPPQGTLAMLQASSSTSSRGSAGKAEKSAPAQPKSDAKEDVWSAPKDQDGSGLTKLNAKFAGRY